MIRPGDFVDVTLVPEIVVNRQGDIQVHFNMTRIVQLVAASVVNRIVSEVPITRRCHTF